MEKRGFDGVGEMEEGRGWSSSNGGGGGGSAEG